MGYSVLVTSTYSSDDRLYFLLLEAVTPFFITLVVLTDLTIALFLTAFFIAAAGAFFIALFVFIAPPSMEELEKRLRGRGTEKEESIQKRLANAAGEMAKTEVTGFFHLVIINDDLDRAYGVLKTVVIDDDQ